MNCPKAAEEADPAISREVVFSLSSARSNRSDLNQMTVDIAKKQMKPKYEGMPRNDRKSSASTAGRNVPKAVPAPMSSRMLWSFLLLIAR